MRQTIDFNQDWKFCLGDCGDYVAISYDDSQWRNLDLPHDWSVEHELCQDAPTGAGGGYVAAGIGWYRKHFDKIQMSPGGKAYLLFEGVFMDSVIFLNGKRIGGHEYGYSSFQVDLTDALEEGENLLAVRVDNSHQPNSRWYTGSGIYRNVWLVRTEAVHIDLWGVRCHTDGIYPERNEASLWIRAFVKNEGGQKAYACLRHELFDWEGKLVSSSGAMLSLEKGDCGECAVRPSVKEPRLWTDETPYLYTLVTTVLLEGVAVDRASVRVGIRTAAFDANRGFLLNGKSVKIKGVCLHHDCGLTGAVGYGEIWKRRLWALKEMGCNGIRCSHNPPDPAFLDLCDEMGFLVMDEAFDEWLLGKNKSENYYSQSFSYGTSQFFARDAEEELCAMLRRDYNHPSVILWSVGNEIPEQSSSAGVKILQYLQDICHREDCSRMVASACDNIAAAEPSRALREFENSLDVVGYNYVGRWRERAETFYEEDRALFPGRRLLGSENPAVAGIRGNYTEKSDSGSYENATLQHEALWRYTISHDFVAGDYLWTGVDYLGESHWPSRGSSFGPLDTAGFRKDAFYYFKSIWNDREITLHLLPHWNWKGQEGRFKQVVCYTNCDEVFLYCNGKLVGRRAYACPRYGARKDWGDGSRTEITTNDLHLSWDVPYEPGEIRAEGFRDGKLAAVRTISTTGEPARLEAHTEHNPLRVKKLALIEISCRDARGRLVPDAACSVHCRVEGCARLVGMDGGNPRDLSLYGNPHRKMLAGRLLAVIRAEKAGKAAVYFSSEGLKEARVELSIYAD